MIDGPLDSFALLLFRVHTNTTDLVDYQLYMDHLGKQMKVMPPLSKLFWQDYPLWKKLMFGPVTTHHYRLVGTRATPEVSRALIMKAPAGAWLESSITGLSLFLAKALSLLGLRMFEPSHL